MELQAQLDVLRKQGLGVAAISYDSPEILADFAKRHRITYPLLSDAGSATIRRYGILNTVVEEALGPNGKDPAVRANLQVFATVNEPTERLRGIPFPGTFMVDRQGRVTSRFFEDYYRERVTTSNLLLRLGASQAPVQATQVSTDHLQLRTYPSDTGVALGNRFSLVFEVTPRAGMHVYAPGASGYRVVSVNIAPQPGVKVYPVSYPASEIYFFAPLKERVPVFQKPFRLLQEVMLDVSPQGQAAFKGKDSITISGTLEYQACDDRICYNPASLPLSWTVALHGFVPGAPAQPPAPAPRQ